MGSILALVFEYAAKREIRGDPELKVEAWQQRESSWDGWALGCWL
jgi:hypothetical protein